MDQHLKKLDSELGKLSFMLHLERQSSIPKTHLFLGMLVALASLLLSLIIPDLLMSSLILVYPLFMTMKAIESMARQEHIQWLNYWFIMATIGWLEQLTFGRLATLLPHYGLVKTLFAIWMWMPSTQGATKVYDLAIRPLLAMQKGGQKIGKPIIKPTLSKSNSSLAKEFKPEEAAADVTAAAEEEDDKEK